MRPLSVRTLSIIGATLMLPACSDSPTNAAVLAPQSIAQRAAIKTTLPSVVLTTYAPDGAYRLELGHNRVRLPNGVWVVDLPSDVVENYANVFQEMLDDAASQAENIVASSPPPSCKDGWNCEMSSPIDLDPISMGLTAGATSGPYTCYDGARAIYNATLRWRGARDNARGSMQRLRNDVASFLLSPEFSQDDFEWIGGLTGLERAIPWSRFLLRMNQMYDSYSLGYSAVTLMVAEAEFRMARLALDILVVQYNTMGCSSANSPNWAETSAQTSAGPTLGGGTTKYGWVCSTRLVDDAEGWPVPVETCEYIFAG